MKTRPHKASRKHWVSRHGEQEPALRLAIGSLSGLLGFISVTALWQCRSHAIQFSHFRCIVQCCLYFFRHVQLSAQLILEYFMTLKRSLHTSCHSPSPLPYGANKLLSVYVDFIIKCNFFLQLASFIQHDNFWSSWVGILMSSKKWALCNFLSATLAKFLKSITGAFL